MVDKKKIVLGWRRQLPDHRDILLTLTYDPATLPGLVSLISLCPPVYDQGQLGSCSANAWCADVEFETIKQGKPTVMPSRLFVYYNERLLEGTVKYDAGAYLRDGIKTLIKQGVCPETEWPYNIKKFKSKPTKKCYKDALKEQAIKYMALVNTPDQLKGCLASGYPFVFGFTVYSSFMSDEVAATGMMPMPQPDDSVEGGHAVMCVGYDEAKQVYIVRNSWGTAWGDQGYFYMPYDYMHNQNLCADFWTIRQVE
jgi:C1A family cysteine protease